MKRQEIKNNFELKDYDLKIEMNEDFFKGTVVISGETFRDSDGKHTDIGKVDLNSSGLKITGVYASTSETEDVKITGQFTEEVKETISITLDEPLSGKFLLTLSFEKTFEEGILTGFYKSKYNGDDLFSTQFEDAFARQCFPCIDQPDAKAVFKVRLSAPGKYKVLSNTQCIKVTKEIFHNEYQFKETPKMSTYLLAFIVGHIECIESNDFRVPVRVWAHRDEVKWGKFALTVATRCIKFFEDYFGVLYPLDKIDLIGFPAFSNGAMENWGLITFRKTALLLDENEATSNQKLRVGEVVCHELAHMWFGNLVTMKWWNDLWLNEGFATWASFKGMNAIKDLFDNTDIWCMFLTNDFERAMADDALSSTHKIKVEVNCPHDVGSIFDAISYSKSASMIKSLEEWIGHDNFKFGLRKYLKKYQYSNAESNDLWDCLDDVFKGKDKIRDFMNPWIQKVGFPYVHIVEEDKKLILTQKRFTIGFEPEEESTPWPIPVSIKWFGNDCEEKILMIDRKMEIEKKSENYKLNSNGFGFYRVWYPSKRRSSILNSDLKLSHCDILDILDDSWAFGFNLTAPFPISMSKDLASKANIQIFISILSNLKKLCSIFYNDSKKKSMLFKAINSIVSKRLETIKMDKESCKSLTIDEMSINSLFVRMGVFTGCFELDDFNIHNQFKPAYFESQADAKFQEIKDFYLKSKIPQIKEQALVGISLCKKQDTFSHLMKDITFVPAFDNLYLFSALSSNITFRDQVVEYFIKNFDEIKKQIKDAGLIRRCIQSVCTKTVTGPTFDLLLEFIEKNKEVSEIKTPILIAGESLKYKTKIRENFKDISLIK